MRIVFALLACLSLAGINANETETCIPQTVFDLGFDGHLLLEDGSIWDIWGYDDNMSLLKGDLVIVKGAYSKSDLGSDHEILGDGFEVDAELVGFIEKDVTILNTYDFTMANKNGDPENIYGAISHLDDGNIMVGINLIPFIQTNGQVVAVGNIDEDARCLVDRETLSFLNFGANIGTTQSLPLTRTVTEVTETGYVFDDGFQLNMSFDPYVSSLYVEDHDISIQFDSKEPLKLTLLISGELVSGQIAVDCSEKFSIDADLEIKESNDWYEEDSSDDYDDEEYDNEEYDDEDEVREASITFVGSKALKEAFLPSGLQVGDTLSFHYISIPGMPEELSNSVWFAVK